MQRKYGPLFIAAARRLSVILGVAGTTYILSMIPGGVSPSQAAAYGCVDWPTSKFIQTPFDNHANNNSGLVKLDYNFYGEGLHTTCNRTAASNDRHAIDLNLNYGDNILPWSTGKVISAGWATGGFAGYGRTVIIDHGDGYWSLYAHLSQINVSVGQTVGISTVVGKVGTSRFGKDGQTVKHLHTAIYRNAKLSNNAAYGGVGVEPKNIKFFRGSGGTYSYFFKSQTISY
ncbi:MAG: M23 family metallopeptidase [Oscillatoria princeps RMCB-10]|jgi:murein DD-endopeptidase MepM/ murein hydrolase activator NlpD|nr:M23 family metallopeptidase [Oscillatoria princeps RMCB-10]